MSGCLAALYMMIKWFVVVVVISSFVFIVWQRNKKHNPRTRIYQPNACIDMQETWKHELNSICPLNSKASILWYFFKRSWMRQVNRFKIHIDRVRNNSKQQIIKSFNLIEYKKIVTTKKSATNRRQGYQIFWMQLLCNSTNTIKQ